MDATTTQPKISLAVLPKAIQDIFANSVITNSVQTVAEIHHLSPEQASALESEIATTLLGLEGVSSFAARTKQALQMTDAGVFAILDDLAVMIFTEEVVASLKVMEETSGPELNKAESVQIPTPSSVPLSTSENRTQPSPAPVQPPTPPAPKPEPAPAAPVPPQPTPPHTSSTDNGKMIGLRKEGVDAPGVKGMRTMKGDIVRLRGPEAAESTTPKAKEPDKKDEPTEAAPAEAKSSGLSRFFKGN